jgi:hypothetical protein
MMSLAGIEQALLTTENAGGLGAARWTADRIENLMSFITHGATNACTDIAGLYSAPELN